LQQDDHSALQTALLRGATAVCALLGRRGASAGSAELWTACTKGEVLSRRSSFIDVITRFAQATLSALTSGVDLRAAVLQRASAFGHSVLMKCVMFLSDLDCCTGGSEKESLFVSDSFVVSAISWLLRVPGVGVDDVDDNRRTALCYACIFGKPNAMKLLVASGANLRHVDIFGSNLAHLTTTAVMFDLLVEELGVEKISAMLNATNLFGWTPLTVAKALHCSELASAMLAYGAPGSDSSATPLVPSWKYRLQVPYLPGTPNDEMLV
jgi:ankyrin repeat protein